MSISFNRNRTQVLFESFIGVTSSDELTSHRNDFKNHTLTHSDISGLSNVIIDDAKDFFYDGIVSFSEGLFNVSKKRYSWATVKLYYSLYYLIRASMASKGYAVLRCSSMYRLHIAAGETPYVTNNKKYNTTHEGTISHYRDVFSTSDNLLSNNIDDMDVYEWMMNAREIVNYRSVAFEEPAYLNIWQYYDSCIDDGSFDSVLLTLESDNYIKCFQEDFAILAIPIKRIMQTIDDFLAVGISVKLPEDRRNFVQEYLSESQKNMFIFQKILKD